MDSLQTLKLTILAGAVIHGVGAQAQLAEIICDETERLAARIYGMNGARKQGQGVLSSSAIIEV